MGYVVLRAGANITGNGGKRDCELFRGLISLCATRSAGTASNGGRGACACVPHGFVLRWETSCLDPEVLSQSFDFTLNFSGMRPHLSSVGIYTPFHHKVLRLAHAPTDARTHPPPISWLIQTCLMSPLTDPHRVGSTHAHRHSITANQRRPHINPSSKASSRPFPMWMRCPKAFWSYLACAKARLWSIPI